MPQPFVITGNIEFAGNDRLEGQVKECDRDLPGLEQRGLALQFLVPLLRVPPFR
jgi:hypothetical protein